MIAPATADRHRIPADLRPLRRELLCEALDGVIVQAQAAIRFTEKGYGDDYGRQAVIRATELFKVAVATTNELHRENQRIAATERLSADTESTVEAAS